MQEKFHKSNLLKKDKLRSLMARTDHPAISRFIICSTSFLLSGAWIVWSWDKGWPWLIASHFVFGLFCCSMFAALHESGHGTAFKSRRLNRLVATFAGIAHLYPSHIFRELHFAHHRYTHIPGKDPEISIGDQAAPVILTNPPIYLAFLTGLPYLQLKIILTLLGMIGSPEFIRKRYTTYIRPKMRKQIAIECFFVTLIYSGLIYLALYVNPGFWGLFTGQVVGHGLLSTYLVMEHNGLPHEGNILEKTRSINVNKVVAYLLWNMPFHAEHHAYPAVPFHALPLLHEEIKEELVHKEDGLPILHYETVRRFGNG